MKLGQISPNISVINLKIYEPLSKYVTFPHLTDYHTHCNLKYLRVRKLNTVCPCIQSRKQKSAVDHQRNTIKNDNKKQKNDFCKRNGGVSNQKSKQKRVLEQGVARSQISHVIQMESAETILKIASGIVHFSKRQHSSDLGKS